MSESEYGWNPVEERALKYGPVWVGLLLICTHSTGVFDLSVGKLADTVQKLDHKKKRPSEKYIEAELARYCELGILKLYDDGTAWIKGRWDYKTMRHLDRHLISAASHLLRYPCVIDDFIARNIAYDITSAIAHIKAGKQKQKQKHKQLETPNGVSAAVAAPVAKAQKFKPEIAPLAELETRIDARWLSGWQKFKIDVAAANKTGEVSEKRLAGLLDHIIDRVAKDGISIDALNFGFAEAHRRGIPNDNYVLNAARNYNPDPSRPVQQPEPESRAPVERTTRIMGGGL